MVDDQTRTHGGAQGHALDVNTFGSRRLQTLKIRKQRFDVLLQLASLETNLIGVAATFQPFLRGMLERGFTSVRDAGGADYALSVAVDTGIVQGPRLFVSGQALSQTGGHADQRPKGVRQRNWFCSCAGLGLVDDLGYTDSNRRGYLLMTVTAAAVRMANRDFFISDS